VSRTIFGFYKSEFSATLLLGAWVVVAISTSFFILISKQESLWRGIAIASLALAILQFGLAGWTMNQILSRKKVFRFAKESEMAGHIKNEIAIAKSIETITRNYRALESIIFFLGLVFLLLGAFSLKNDFMAGSGIGICLQSAVTFIYLLFRTFRVSLYKHELETLSRRMS
jgi:hypothetical protein